jgi:hypothetical protein
VKEKYYFFTEKVWLKRQADKAAANQRQGKETYQLCSVFQKDGILAFY